MYKVEYADSENSALSANLIAKKMLVQIGEEGNGHTLMDKITEHRFDEVAVKSQDPFVKTSSGTKRRRQTMQVFSLCIKWHNINTTYVALKYIEQAYPLQLAEYAVAAKISVDPDFAWWVPLTLKKKNRIIAKVKSKYWLKNHKFRIKLPNNMNQEIEFDHENANTLWWDVVCQEMKNVRPAFETWQKPEGDIPPVFQDIKCHFIFSINMGENFCRKARFVAGDHITEISTTLTYASVVLRYLVRISLTIAALNGLEILSCDINNASLTDKCREDILTRASAEFGSEARTNIIVRMALYSLKSGGAEFCAYWDETLNDIEFLSTKVDPDVWYRHAVKPNGFEYYGYIMCYVDDILCIPHDLGILLRQIQVVFKFKGDKTDQPEKYLGSQVVNIIVYGAEGWYMSAEKYVRATVDNVKHALAKQNQRLLTHCKTPIMSGYWPETDTLTEIKVEGVTQYQEMVGVLRWVVDLGRVDILLETALVSTCLDLPRRGHLEQIFHVFGYLKMNPKRKLCFDPQHLTLNDRQFALHDRYDLYWNAKQAVPADAPNSRGDVVSIYCFVEADHAGNIATRRSQTGVQIFVNKAPIIWYSKQQNTVETSKFSGEFIDLKTATELIEALCYKLQVFGTHIEVPTNMFCDNEDI